MADQRSWTVTYTARRKVSRYETCAVTLQITDEQFRQHCEAPPAEALDATDDEEFAEILAQIAHDLGEPVDAVWEPAAEQEERLDSEDFEYVETP